jgi:hypothetical protein
MTEPSPQTRQLLDMLAEDGFVGPGEDVKTWVQPTDGFVEHRIFGIRVHADADMIRLIVPGHDGIPEYRLALGRRNLASRDALRIMAVHARAAADQRRN